MAQSNVGDYAALVKTVTDLITGLEAAAERDRGERPAKSPRARSAGGLRFPDVVLRVVQIGGAGLWRRGEAS
jgi:hypothetical protein